ncbi:hypothetical protein SBRCBS47491_007245 [Sporothrix bragantina]|uniref:Uncharacterized protein n=1 Tax=Sporothrix bragantina TaxID=671064 RepID=A0ABP0CDX8_9PEZI
MVPTEYTIFFVVYIMVIYPRIYNRIDGMINYLNSPPIFRTYSHDRSFKHALLALLFVAIPLIPRFIWPQIQGYYYEGRILELEEDFGFFWPIRLFFREMFGWLNDSRTNAGHIEKALDPEGLVVPVVGY